MFKQKYDTLAEFLVKNGFRYNIVRDGDGFFNYVIRFCYDDDEDCPCNRVENYEEKALTNAQKIRKMSDEELADFLNSVKNIAIGADRIGCQTKKLVDLEWLQKEPTEDR